MGDWQGIRKMLGKKRIKQIEKNLEKKRAEKGKGMTKKLKASKNIGFHICMDEISKAGKGKRHDH